MAKNQTKRTSADFLTTGKFIDLSIPDNKAAIGVMMDYITKVVTIGRKLGFNAPLDKSFWRQAKMAEVLGHSVCPSSCGSGMPDAIDANAKSQEYKTVLVDQRAIDKFVKTGVLPRRKFIYSSSTKTSNVNRALEEDHFYGFYSRDTEELIAILGVSATHIHSQLQQSQLQHQQSKLTRGDNATETTASTADCGVVVGGDVTKVDEHTTVQYVNAKYFTV